MINLWPFSPKLCKHTLYINLLCTILVMLQVLNSQRHLKSVQPDKQLSFSGSLYYTLHDKPHVCRLDTTDSNEMQPNLLHYQSRKYMVFCLQYPKMVTIFTLLAVQSISHSTFGKMLQRCPQDALMLHTSHKDLEVNTYRNMFVEKARGSNKNGGSTKCKC